MTDTSTAAPATDRAADQALRARHRAMWALGDYPAVAADVIPDLGPALVAPPGCAPVTGSGPV